MVTSILFSSHTAAASASAHSPPPSARPLPTARAPPGLPPAIPETNRCSASISCSVLARPRSTHGSPSLLADDHLSRTSRSHPGSRRDRCDPPVTRGITPVTRGITRHTRRREHDRTMRAHQPAGSPRCPGWPLLPWPPCALSRTRQLTNPSRRHLCAWLRVTAGKSPMSSSRPIRPVLPWTPPPRRLQPTLAAMAPPRWRARRTRCTSARASQLQRVSRVCLWRILCRADCSSDATRWHRDIRYWFGDKCRYLIWYAVTTCVFDRSLRDGLSIVSCSKIHSDFYHFSKIDTCSIRIKYSIRTQPHAISCVMLQVLKEKRNSTSYSNRPPIDHSHEDLARVIFE